MEIQWDDQAYVVLAEIFRSMSSYGRIALWKTCVEHHSNPVFEALILPLVKETAIDFYYNEIRPVKKK